MVEGDFANALKSRRQISITVTARRTRRAITIPAWLVADDRTLWLLPMDGSDTQWYWNVERDRALQSTREMRKDLRARGVRRQFAGVVHFLRLSAEFDKYLIKTSWGHQHLNDISG